MPAWGARVMRMVQISAGLLLSKIKNNRRVFLIAHPGGPFYARKDDGVWTLPKGEKAANEDLMMTAYREFREEMGAFEMHSDQIILLGHCTLKSGKEIYGFLALGDFDLQTQKSNTFELEWPPKSGMFRKFPEIDRAAWVGADTARQKLHPAQAVFIDRAEAALLNLSDAVE